MYFLDIYNSDLFKQVIFAVTPVLAGLPANLERVRGEVCPIVGESASGEARQAPVPGWTPRAGRGARVPQQRCRRGRGHDAGLAAGRRRGRPALLLTTTQGRLINRPRSCGPRARPTPAWPRAAGRDALGWLLDGRPEFSAARFARSGRREKTALWDAPLPLRGSLALALALALAPAVARPPLPPRGPGRPLPAVQGAHSRPPWRSRSRPRPPGPHLPAGAAHLPQRQPAPGAPPPVAGVGGGQPRRPAGGVAAWRQLHGGGRSFLLPQEAAGAERGRARGPPLPALPGAARPGRLREPWG